MRSEYELKGGRPNPYLKRIGATGRKAIVDRFLESEHLVRLEAPIAEAFPSDKAVNAALRLVIELRKLDPGTPRKAAPTARARKKPGQLG